MIKDNSITIPSEANLASFRNIDEIDDRSKASMSELMATLSCLFIGVVFCPVLNAGVEGLGLVGLYLCQEKGVHW